VDRQESAADSADVVQTISQRVIRTLRHMSDLEARSAAAMATGYDHRLDDEPDRAHTLAASDTQRMAFGERAGQQARRMGLGFGEAGGAGLALAALAWKDC